MILTFFNIIEWFGFIGETGTRLSGGNEPGEGLQTIVMLHSWRGLWRNANLKLQRFETSLWLSSVLFTANHRQSWSQSLRGGTRPWVAWMVTALPLAAAGSRPQWQCRVKGDSESELQACLWGCTKSESAWQSHESLSLLPVTVNQAAAQGQAEPAAATDSAAAAAKAACHICKLRRSNNVYNVEQYMQYCAIKV